MNYWIYLNEKLIKKETIAKSNVIIDEYKVVQNAITKYLQLNTVLFNEVCLPNSYFCSKCGGTCKLATEGYNETDDYEVFVVTTCSWAVYHIKNKKTGKELVINFRFDEDDNMDVPW